MGYVTGEPILDDEYNTFVNSSSSPYGYNHFAGTGATVYGLGQTHIATQAAGDTITAAQWNALFTGMDNIANHTNRTLTTGPTTQRYKKYNLTILNYYNTVCYNIAFYLYSIVLYSII